MDPGVASAFAKKDMTLEDTMKITAPPLLESTLTFPGEPSGRSFKEHLPENIWIPTSHFAQNMPRFLVVSLPRFWATTVEVGFRLPQISGGKFPWPSPPMVPFPSASFDPLDGLESELKMQVAKVPLQQETKRFGAKMIVKSQKEFTVILIFNLSQDFLLQFLRPKSANVGNGKNDGFSIAN